MNKIILLLFLSGIFFNSFAQNADITTVETHVYFYTFENLSTQEQVDKLIADVKKISGIVEAKVNCKWEINRGELIFKVQETITGNENIENLDMAPVKQAIISNNLVPIECKERILR